MPVQKAKKSVFIHDRIVYIENFYRSTKQLPEKMNSLTRKNEFISKVAGYKVNVQT